MFKRLLSAIVIFAVVLSLFAACDITRKSGGEDGTTAKIAEKKTIVIFIQDDLIKDSYTDYYKEYEEQNNAEVKRILVPKDKYVQTYMVTINGGQQVDVLGLNGQDVRSFVAKGLISDLTEEIGYWDRFIESSIETYTFNGRRYAVPFLAGTTSGVYYNKEILDKYNLQPPETLQDLIEMNKVLSKDGIATFSFGGATVYMWPMWYFDVFAQTSGGKSVERTIEALRGQAKFTDPDFVEAMKVLETFGKENLFQPGFNGADSAAGNAVFNVGKAALFFGGTWEIDGFRKAGLTGDKLGMVPFPIVKEGAVSQQTGCVSSSALGLMSKIDPNNKDLALKLIDYLSSDKKAAEINKLRTEAVSPNKNVRTEGIDPLYDGVVSEKLLPSTVTFLDWIWPPEITKEFQVGIQAVVGGKISAEEQMEKIQKVFDEIKAKGYDFDAVN